MSAANGDESFDFNELCSWAKQALETEVELERIASGASSKSFFRVKGALDKPILALHTPLPDDLSRYLHASNLFAAAQLRVPTVYHTDLARNFALTEDFGDDLYARVIGQEPHRQDELYRSAAAGVNQIQAIPVQDCGLPLFDDALLEREAAFFPTWYAAKYRNAPLSTDEANDYQRISATLQRNFTAQVQVVIHHDYHSENLFALEPGPGLVDFTGALVGPQTYDMASLFLDLYMDLEPEAQLDYLVRQWEGARELGLPVPTDFSDHYEHCELTALQRLVKVVGQFVWLHIELGRPATFLEYLPRAEMRIHAIAMRYRELRPLALMLEARLNP